jgi:hypothetical protein
VIRIIEYDLQQKSPSTKIIENVTDRFHLIDCRFSDKFRIETNMYSFKRIGGKFLLMLGFLKGDSADFFMRKIILSIF